METKLHESVSQWISQFDGHGEANSTVTLTCVSGSTVFFETKRYGPVHLIVPPTAIPDCVSSEMDLSESSDVFLVTSTATDSCDPQALLVLNEKLERIRPNSPGALNVALEKLFPEFSLKQESLINKPMEETDVISDEEETGNGKSSMHDDDDMYSGSDYEGMWEDVDSDCEGDGDADYYGYDMASLDYAGTETHELRSKQGYLYAMAKEAKQLCAAAQSIDVPLIYNSDSANELDYIYHSLLPWCSVEPSIHTFCINITIFFGGFVGSDATLASLGIPTNLPVKMSLKFDKKYWYEQKRHYPCIDECQVNVVELTKSQIKAVGRQLELEVVEFNPDLDPSPIAQQNVAEKDGDNEEDGKLEISKQNLYGIEVLLPELVKTYFDFMEKSKITQEDLIFELQILSTMENPLIGLMCFLGKRLSTLTSWCVVCWNNLPHKVSRLRTCDQELCLFKFEELGLGASVLHELKQAPVLVDFELSLAIAAAMETTRDVFEPFPGFLLKNCELRGRSGWFSNNNPNKRKKSQSSHNDVMSAANDLDTSNKMLNVLRYVLSSYPSIQEMQKCSTEAALKKFLAKSWGGTSETGFLPYCVLRFLLSTNRLTMCPLDNDNMFDFPDAIYQFAVLHDNPEKEAYFENRRANNGGSFFAFHGSGVSNWFSILRNGLRSMSGTRYMSSGAAHGDGIYIASNSTTSMRYMNTISSGHKGWNKGNLQWGFGILAICEIINGSLRSGQRHLVDTTMVVRPECEQDIVIRYVIVFKSYDSNYNSNYDNAVALGTELMLKSKKIDLSAHHKRIQDEYHKMQEDKQRLSMESRWRLASLIWNSAKQDYEDEDRKLHQDNSNKDMTTETRNPVDKRGNSYAASLFRSMQAVQKELKTIMKQINDAKQHCSNTAKNILAGIKVELPDESNLCKWHVYLNQNLFSGSKLYNDLKDRAKGKQEISVKLECVFPNTYPMSPPFIRIVSPRFSFHTGHVTVGGSICMELLTESGWSPAFCFESVLVQIVHAMIEGGGRLDKKDNSEYSEIEAKEAYVRVARQHGWMK